MTNEPKKKGTERRGTPRSQAQVSPRGVRTAQAFKAAVAALTRDGRFDPRGIASLSAWSLALEELYDVATAHIRDSTTLLPAGWDDPVPEDALTVIFFPIMVSPADESTFNARNGIEHFLATQLINQGFILKPT